MSGASSYRRAGDRPPRRAARGADPMAIAAIAAILVVGYWMLLRPPTPADLAAELEKLRHGGSP